jgi:hypothetical protein
LDSGEDKGSSFLLFLFFGFPVFIYLLKQQCKIKERKGTGDGDAIISFVFVLFFLLHNLHACSSVGDMCCSCSRRA